MTTVRNVTGKTENGRKFAKKVSCGKTKCSRVNEFNGVGCQRECTAKYTYISSQSCELSN